MALQGVVNGFVLAVRPGFAEIDGGNHKNSPFAKCVPFQHTRRGRGLYAKQKGSRFRLPVGATDQSARYALTMA